jgi:lipopolysaccharide export system permease protein
MSKRGSGFARLRGMVPGKFNRYILWDVFKLFFLCVSAMTVVISFGLVGQQLVRQGLGWYAVLKLLPYISLIALQFSLPATLLFAVCCVYGRISADNEIVALKSAGISPHRIIRWMAFLAFLLSFPAVWINDLAVSWGRPGVERVILRSFEEIVLGTLRARRSYENEKGFTIHVLEVRDRWLIRPTIFLFNEQTGDPMTIHAEKAKISIDADNDRLVIDLVNSHGEINDKSSTRFQMPGAERFSMPLNQASRKSSSAKTPSQFSMREIPVEIAALVSSNERTRESMAIQAAVGLGLGRYGQLYDPKLQQLKETVADRQRRVIRLSLEPARRWALGFSCFFFVWVGVPMSILIRSADYAWTFGLCFIPILLIYYPLFGLALDRAKDGSWPPASLWLGNVVLLVLGTVLLRRVMRH